MAKTYRASNGTMHCTAGTKNDRKARQNRTRNPKDGFESCTVHHKKLRNRLISELFLALFCPKSSTIFLKMRFDPNRDPNRDVRRCTKQYEIARKDHSAAHKTYIKYAFFHKKRARCRFCSAPAMPCVTPLPGRSFDRWCPQPARACWAWSGRRC